MHTILHRSHDYERKNKMLYDRHWSVWECQFHVNTQTEWAVIAARNISSFKITATYTIIFLDKWENQVLYIHVFTKQMERGDFIVYICWQHKKSGQMLIKLFLKAVWCRTSFFFFKHKRSVWLMLAQQYQCVSSSIQRCQLWINIYSN